MYQPHQLHNCLKKRKKCKSPEVLDPLPSHPPKTSGDLHFFSFFETVVQLVRLVYANVAFFGTVVHLVTFISISLYICLYLSISFYISLYLFIYLYISISLYIYYLYIYIYIYVSIYLSISVYIPPYLSLSYKETERYREI